LQEGFARALASLETFRGDCPLAAWVWKIAVRVALEHKRAKRPLLPADDAAGWLPAAELVERGHSPRLADALRSLPPRRRLIVFLRYFADCSYTEIASICAISEGTVAASLAQSRTVLAKSLGVEQAETTKEVGR
jgi:RNA polymerase sigma-70 factor (ECF subfamily)